MQITVIGHFQFRKSVRERRMRPKLESRDIEVVDDTNFCRRHFMHVHLGPLGAAVKQEAENRHRSWHHHALTDPFQHALVMLVFDEALEYVVRGEHNPVGMNAEPASYDFEGMSR